jgi:acetoin utilization deacetylase AcuC-like enzyme
LKSAKQTGQGNPLADSMRSNEHELYELRILVRDRLIDSRLFQVTDEQEIVMAGARKSGRERRQKRNLSPARLGEGEAQGASDIEPPADSMPWTCYNCQQDNSAADGVCKQCDEVRVSAQQLIEYLRRPMARPSDAAEVLPLAMGFDERCVHVRKVGAGTRSESLSAAFSCLGAEGLLDGTLHVPPRAAARAELALAHDKKYLDAHDYKLPEVEAEAGTEDAGASLEDALAAVEAQAQTRLSVAQASALSAGIVTDVVYSVLSGRSYNGVALVRPCGAHIDRAGSPSGGINVLAVAAKAALRNSAKRVLVVDWAVAHGVGTQRICFDDPAIVTFSMHGTTDRQQRAWVQCDSSDCRKWRKLPVGVDVPSSGKWYCSMNPDRNCDRCQAPEENYADENQKDEPKESDPETVGKGKAEGRNINLTWLANGMGDADYVHAATRLLLPMIYDFSPDVILVGPRFDAANGARRSDEPCGHDKVTPAGFAQILSLLHSAAPGRIVLLCEGGNNLRATCESLVSSVRVLKGSHDKQRLRAGARPKVECVQAVSYTADQLEQYWRGLHHFQDDEEEDEEQEEEEEEEQEEEEEEVGREEEKGATEATEVIDEADSSSRAQVLKSAASRSPVAASIATNVELQQQIKQLQLQLELQQASQTMEMLSTQDAPPAKRKRTTPLAIGSSVALTDGRKGVLRSAGHGYMQVELTAGAQQGEIVHVRSAEVVQGPLKHAPGKTQGSSNKSENSCKHNNNL